MESLKNGSVCALPGVKMLLRYQLCENPQFVCIKPWSAMFAGLDSHWHVHINKTITLIGFPSFKLATNYSVFSGTFPSTWKRRPVFLVSFSEHLSKQKFGFVVIRVNGKAAQNHKRRLVRAPTQFQFCCPWKPCGAKLPWSVLPLSARQTVSLSPIRCEISTKDITPMFGSMWKHVNPSLNCDGRPTDGPNVHRAVQHMWIAAMESHHDDNLHIENLVLESDTVRLVDQWTFCGLFSCN